MEHWQLSEIGLEPHHPQVLQSEQEGRTIAIALPEGERLQEHQVHERAWLVVISGGIEIITDVGTVRGEQGFIATFVPKEPHEVRALTDSRLLLILAPWPGPGHPALRDQM